MLFLPVSLSGRILASELIHYFSSHPAPVAFQGATPPNKTVLGSTSKKSDPSFRISDCNQYS